MSGTRFSRRGSRFAAGHQSVANGLSGAAVMGTPSFRRKPDPAQEWLAFHSWNRRLLFSLDTGFRRYDERKLSPALLGDLAVGFVDGSDLLGGNGDEFLRHAAG